MKDEEEFVKDEEEFVVNISAKIYIIIVIALPICIAMMEYIFFQKY